MNNSDPIFLGKPLDFYIKWSATIVALVTVYLTSHDFVPLNKYFGLLTAMLWGWLGVIWKQPSIWLLNIIMFGMYLSGIILA